MDRAYFRRRDTFQSFWHGGSLSPLAWLSLSSFAKQGHRVELYCYEKMHLPEGVDRKSADEIISKDGVFYIHDSYSTFANLFRFQLLIMKGGWWTDTDVLCTGKDIPDNEIVFSEEEHGAINNALIKFPKNHPVSREMVSEIRKLKLEDIRFGQTGADLLTRVVKLHQLDRLSRPREHFYPLHWLETYKFIIPEFSDEVANKIESSPFVHFWNNIFRRFGFVVSTNRPPADSFLDVQYKKYQIYDRYNLRKIDENELRMRVNTYLKQDWAAEHASSHGLTIPYV